METLEELKHQQVTVAGLGARQGMEFQEHLIRVAVAAVLYIHIPVALVALAS
jgi:hypothetical protein